MNKHQEDLLLKYISRKDVMFEQVAVSQSSSAVSGEGEGSEVLHMVAEGIRRWEDEEGDKTMMAMVMPNSLMELPKTDPNSLLVSILTVL